MFMVHIIMEKGNIGGENVHKKVGGQTVPCAFQPACKK